MDNNSPSSLERYAQQLFGDWLKEDDVTEIAVNRPGEVWVECRGVWQCHSVPMSFDDAERFAMTLAAYMDDTINDVKPVLSATLPTGERVQVVCPPAVERDTVSITIRKPAKFEFTHDQYRNSQFYTKVMSDAQEEDGIRQQLLMLYRARRIPEFMELAVAAGKTIIIAGGTGSGKTSYMKMLIKYIPQNLRLITIEDNPEIHFYHHRNYVHLFYPSEADSTKGSTLTAASLVRSCFRMKPSRILLAEVRGAETWDFYKAVGSGHSGSMTSVHAGSKEEAIEGLVTRCFQNPECQRLPYEVVKRIVLEQTDIICHIEAEGKDRWMGEIYYRDAEQEGVL
ncbi:P-type DNA transfer ATPase VirB11 [Chromobacterium amazonense]|uniref:Type IV secretion system protein n=1 Tax=Chromobacterium amazonense TaxID=1382803 RepID=A0A2S9WYE8_9NEIS|nr:P-type DNA transfer ATPase VirB11 [Chromobacterium amazonense]PRP68491.1 P-type DNA transfer ATPase VirB11 [Chromobacterium amazonense]